MRVVTGLIGGQFYVVVGVHDHLSLLRYLRTASAALGKDVTRHIGVRTQLARDTGAAFASILRARSVRDVGLLPTRRGYRRVRRGLRRLAAAALKFCDARQELVDSRQERVVLTDELVDLRHQRQHQPLKAFGVERIDPLGWHPELESDRTDALNASLVSHTAARG